MWRMEGCTVQGVTNEGSQPPIYGALITTMDSGNAGPDDVDDGGTPAWCARHSRVIDVGKPDPWAKWNKLPVGTRIITLIFIFFVVPWLFMVAALLVMVALHLAGIDPG